MHIMDYRGKQYTIWNNGKGGPWQVKVRVNRTVLKHTDAVYKRVQIDGPLYKQVMSEFNRRFENVG